MSLDETERFLRELHERERQLLFGNEAFVIGMLQTVSTAVAIAAFAQIDKLDTFVGRWPMLAFLSATILCLALAVTAAFFRHQYKMWDVKAAVAAPADKADRVRKTQRYLRAMRICMGIATASLAGGLVAVIAGMWRSYICG